MIKYNLLIVTIPAFNEEQSIANVIEAIPRKIKGIKKVRIFVGDDGSDDKTALVAEQSGADTILSHKKNLGLAKTFSMLMTAAQEAGADIVVNIDADNQYDPNEISLLIAPIIKGNADMVSGKRKIGDLDHMPLSKRIGNRLGSAVVRWLSNCDIEDASSGFRAYNRDCLASFNLESAHTYTHETIIQAAYSNMVIEEVPITFRRREHGESRLIAGIWSHIKKSGATIIRTVLLYKAFSYLLSLGALILSLGILLGLRFIYYLYLGEGQGHIQSLILAATLFNVGFTTCVLAVIADLISMNRRLLTK